MVQLQETRVHLEPAQSDANLPLPRDRAATTAAETQSDQPQRTREGLPAAFRMRREKHYVEQLIGDAPLRTVREIPLGDIEPPAVNDSDLGPLRQSIQDVGILQPLLVAPAGPAAGPDRGSEQGSGFSIIAGANRYRVATQLGLRTVPCLVCETNGHTADALRTAATRRAVPPVATEPSMTPLVREPRDQQAVAGLRDVTARLAFVSAVMPALDVAGYDSLRWNTLTDLLRVEMERARSTAAAIEWLSVTDGAAVRESMDAASAIDAVLDAVGPEARLQGVRLEISSALNGYQVTGDRAMIVRALIGLIQEMLTLSRAGSTLRVDCSGTTVRPAMIVTITQDECEIGEAAADRFFDARFAEHPNGLPGALVLAAVSHAARLHGGRVHARAQPRGCTATFVIPN